MESSAYKIDISGIVQGVGFKPFIFRLAKKYNLYGHVSNTSKGVQICVEGKQSAVYNFLESIRKQNPVISYIESMEVFEKKPMGEKTFTINKNEKLEDNNMFMSSDLSTCADCRDDIFDKGNRRYRYPFTTCTYCGSRYSIIRDNRMIEKILSWTSSKCAPNAKTSL